MVVLMNALLLAVGREIFLLDPRQMITSNAPHSVILICLREIRNGLSVPQELDNPNRISLRLGNMSKTVLLGTWPPLISPHNIMNEVEFEMDLRRMMTTLVLQVKLELIETIEEPTLRDNNLRLESMITVSRAAQIDVMTVSRQMTGGQGAFPRDMHRDPTTFYLLDHVERDPAGKELLKNVSLTISQETHVEGNYLRKTRIMED